MMKHKFQPYLEEDGGSAGGLTADEQDFLESMGLAASDEDDASEDDDEEDEPEPPEDDEDEDDDESEPPDDEEDDDEDESGKGKKPDGKPPKTQKDAAAFARMRAENRKLQQTLNQLAKGLRLPDSLSLEEKSEKLSELIHKAQSDKTGVPVEILQRLDKLEQENQMFQSKEVELYNIESFNSIQKKSGVSDEDIEQFKEDLAKNGFDYEHSKQPLEPAFVTMYFDSILKRKIEEAGSSEEERRKKADKHSTTPASGKGSGSEGGDETKINSVHALDALLEGKKG